jgi:hypothetical protein
LVSSVANGIPSEITFIYENWNIKDLMMEVGIRAYHVWQQE